MTNSNGKISVEEWLPADAEETERSIAELAGVLHAVVHTGAGIGFVIPFSLDDAAQFWREKVLPGVRARTRRVVIAVSAGNRIVGTVQLDLATPPNQPHRADVAKMMVHPQARRQGIARQLMTAIEEIAVSSGRTLITLDTVTNGPAESLYRSLGFSAAGVIPRYARNSLNSHMDDTTIMYKELQSR